MSSYMRCSTTPNFFSKLQWSSSFTIDQQLFFSLSFSSAKTSHLIPLRKKFLPPFKARERESILIQYFIQPFSPFQPNCLKNSQKCDGLARKREKSQKMSGNPRGLDPRDPVPATTLAHPPTATTTSTLTATTVETGARKRTTSRSSSSSEPSTSSTSSSSSSSLGTRRRAVLQALKDPSHYEELSIIGNGKNNKKNRVSIKHFCIAQSALSDDLC